MKLTGKVLGLGSIDKCNRMFSKDCKVTYPELIPIAYRFKFNNLDHILGYAAVSRSSYDFTVTCEIYDQEFIDYMKETNKVYIGGYYFPVKKSLRNDGIIEVTEACLAGIGVLSPKEVADESLYLVKESEE